MTVPPHRALLLKFDNILFETFLTGAFAHVNKLFCDACRWFFSEVGLGGFSVFGNKLRLSLLMKLYFL